MNCKEEIEIAMPIFGGEPRRAIGVIGLVGSSREQKMTILSKEASFLAFVEQIADFISVKSQERKESARREALLGTLHTTLENIQQGTLVIGTDHSITMTNRSAQEQLEDDNLVGKKVLIEATGDTLNRYAEYRVTVGERAYHLMGSYMKIPQKIRDYEGVLIFIGAGKSRTNILRRLLYHMAIRTASWGQALQRCISRKKSNELRLLLRPSSLRAKVERERKW